jgi:excisionase family DNA binding protein
VATHRSGGRDARKIQNLRDHPEPYVTTTDLAEYWLVSRKQIYKQIEAGTLKAIRLGPRLLRISTAEAIAFEQLAKLAPPPDAERSSREERVREISSPRRVASAAKRDRGRRRK